MPKVGRPKDVDLIESLKEDLKKAPRPKMSRISSHFIKECGGEANFAKFLHADYIAAGEGSAIRQRIMALIATLSKNDDEGETIGLTDAEIEKQRFKKIINKKLKKIFVSNKGINLFTFEIFKKIHIN